MKILLVITSLSVGGAERLVTSLADQLDKLEHEVVLVSLHGKIEMQPESENVEIINLNMKKSVFGVIRAMHKLRNIIKNRQPDVVNTHLVHANIIVRLLRIITPMRRLISSAHNSNEEVLARYFAYRCTSKLADKTTNVSKTAVRAFEKYGAVKKNTMVAIHNGIDTEKFKFSLCSRNIVRKELKLSDSSQLLLAVGRLQKEKDYHNLLMAFSRLCPSYPSTHLAIAGDGPMRDELEAYAKLLKVEENVSFLGVRRDIPALMSASDVFVLSSAWEGFGLVVAEAMACECIPVVTDSGGVKEVVGECGFIVPPCDADSLNIALEKSLNLTSMSRNDLVIAGRKRVVKYFSVNNMAQSYLDLYI